MPTLAAHPARPLSTPAPVGRTAIGLFVVLALGFLVMLGRVVQLQVAPTPELAAHMGERQSEVSEPARRGDIIDRRGRVLALTHFGARCFADPARLRLPIDADVISLAQALGLKPEEVGQRLAAALDENQRRAEAKAAGDADARPEIRYVALGGVLEDWRVDSLRRLAIPGIHLETRSVRDVVADDLVSSLLGKVGFENSGLMGAEKLLDQRLEPVDGSLRYVRDARGRALWVEPGGYQPPQRGEDVRMSVDLQLQRIAIEELTRGVEEADAQGGRCVILDPDSGEILAMADIIRPVAEAVVYDFTRVIPKDNSLHGTRYVTISYAPAALRYPELARNRCVEDVYEPGSTFKPFMWAAVTELGLALPSEVFDTFGGRWSTPYGRAISDVVKKDMQSWSEVLVNSSNIGMILGTMRLTPKQMRDAVIKFGFGRRTGLGLPGEATGLVTSLKDWSKYTHTSVATGYEVAITPVQMVRAFSAFARTGDRAGTLPPIRITAADPEITGVEVTKRVLPAPVAQRVRQTLRGVTANLDRKLAAKNPPEIGWKYELFGKSGTAEIPLSKPPPGKKRPKGSDGYFSGQYNTSFVAGGPVDNPRLICLVVIDDPGPQLVRERRHYGASTAGPVVRRIMERALSYLGVPASPPPPPDAPVHHAD